MVLLLVSLALIQCLALLVWNADVFSSPSTARLQGRLHKRDVCSALFLTDRRGLLRGVVDTDADSSRFYADTIDTSREGLAWLDESGLMWEAAVEDAEDMGVPVEEYIANIKANTKKFALSDTIFDRKELLRALRDAFTDKGKIFLLLGGKSVGKSYVLQTLKNQYNSATSIDRKKKNLRAFRKTFPKTAQFLLPFGGKVIQTLKKQDNSASANAQNETTCLILYVDGRGTTLEDSLATEIAKLSLAGRVSQQTADSWVNAFKLVGKGATEATFEVYIDKSYKVTVAKKAVQPILNVLLGNLTKARTQLALLQIFVQLANSKNAYPLVIIDEANIVLGRGKNETEIILQDFVKRTKQNKELSLILASTDHAYPYQLEREGLNLQDVTRVIFAGEIPPSDMWKLLVNATYEQGDNTGDIIIGMGPRLAGLCLAAYGGHFLTVENAIARLCQEESEFKASSLLPVLTANIIECLDSHMSSMPLLDAMAKSGFAPIETPDSAVVDLIAKLNIGGVVNEESTICGLSETKWDGTTCGYALIPSSESVRLVIARTLNAMPAVKVMKTNLPNGDTLL
jgi:hypothetical protein